MSADREAREEVTFVVPGKPHAKQRARILRRRGIPMAITPDETVKAEQFIRLTAATHFPAPFSGPVHVDITAVFSPPASWSGAKVTRTLGHPHCQRPDLDNCVKSATDALNGIAYADDGQVAEISCRKVWGDVARTIITVRGIGGAS